jgi:hypothetical protein
MNGARFADVATIQERVTAVPEKKQNKRYKQINFIDLQNNHHTSHHTVGNVHKASGNCQQRPL